MNASLPRRAQRPIAASSVRMPSPSAATIAFGRMLIVAPALTGARARYSRTGTR